MSNAAGDMDDEADEFNQMFWKMGKRSFKIFMDELGKLQPRSLFLTKDVLEERNQLEITIEGIQIDVKMGLNKLEQLLTECKVLDSHQADIDLNKDFTYTVNEQVVKTKPTAVGQYTTNCTVCNRTCHEHCAFSNDKDKIRCWAMTNGRCRICPRKCSWDLHKNHPYVYVIEVHPVTKMAADLKKRYEDAKGEKLKAEQIVLQCQEDFDKVQIRVLGLVDQARKIIDRLSEIALRPNPLSTVDYIDILIESEKAEAQPGWKERMAQLIKVRERALQLQELAKNHYDPFAEMKKKYDQERKQNQQKLQDELKKKKQQQQQQRQQQQNI